MPALLTDGVTAGYGRVPIINDISLTADTGLVTTIVGPNGAGKSTFAKTLVGILKPMSGTIMVNGLDITSMPGHRIPRHGLVYVPQNDNVFKRLTVRENLEVGGFAAKGDSSARMAEILEIFPDLAKAVEKASAHGRSVGDRLGRADGGPFADVHRRRVGSDRTHLATRHRGHGRRAKRRARPQALELRACLRGWAQPCPRSGKRDRRARFGVDLPRSVAKPVSPRSDSAIEHTRRDG
jgi:ABC-type Fe3+/spermidine/putrescine transport system ATPase subunit